MSNETGRSFQRITHSQIATTANAGWLDRSAKNLATTDSNPRPARTQNGRAETGCDLEMSN